MKLQYLSGLIAIKGTYNLFKKVHEFCFLKDYEINKNCYILDGFCARSWEEKKLLIDFYILNMFIEYGQTYLVDVSGYMNEASVTHPSNIVWSSINSLGTLRHNATSNT